MKIFLGLMLGAAMLAGHASGQNRPAVGERVPDTMDERVRACVGCHGEQGRGMPNEYFPRLAGKPAGYLYNQLVAFRDYRRKYAPMNYLLAYLPDAYLMRMAEYYAGLNPPPLVLPASSASPQQLADGQRIATQGIPGKKIPACIACHGGDYAGRAPGIPGLLGLRADYISAQLGAWRYGVRTAVAPDCMQLIASTLTEPEVSAVAAWLASQPVTTARPAPAQGQRLPIACGSQPQK